jgi:hypothetical protein
VGGHGHGLREGAAAQPAPRGNGSAQKPAGVKLSLGEADKDFERYNAWRKG